MTPALSRGIRRRQQKDFEAQLRALGCDPTEILVMIATNNVPCSVCQRTPGKQRVALPSDLQHTCKCAAATGLYDPECWRCSGSGLATATERTCQSCYGTLFEAVSPMVRAQVASKMLDKLVPDLRSVDHTNTDGSMRPEWRLVLVDPLPVQAPAGGAIEGAAKRLQAPER